MYRRDIYIGIIIYRWASALSTKTIQCFISVGQRSQFVTVGTQSHKRA